MTPLSALHHALRAQLVAAIRKDGRVVHKTDGAGKVLGFVRTGKGARQARVRLDDGRIRQYALTKLRPEGD